MSPESTTPFCTHHGCVEKTLVRIEQSLDSMNSGFASVNATLKEVAGDLREGAVSMTEMRTRINLLERVVYGAVGLALTSIVLALLSLILRTP